MSQAYALGEYPVQNGHARLLRLMVLCGIKKRRSKAGVIEMRRFWLAAALVVMPAAANAVDGNTQCSTFASEVQHHGADTGADDAVLAYLSWANGYMTAKLIEDGNHQTDLSKWKPKDLAKWGPEAELKWLVGWCAAHPDSYFIYGVEAYYSNLPEIGERP